jgi:hypothetical protein
VFGPLAARYTDETARALARRDEPWAAAYAIAGPAPPSSLQLRWDAEARQLVLNSDHALGRATIKVLDHHRVAIETLHATVKPGETRVAIKDNIDGVFVELGDFRDFVVADSNGEIRAQWGTPRRLRPINSRVYRLTANATESRRAPRILSKLFQNQAVSLQTFPNKALAVLWDFKGLQGLQTENDHSPNFSGLEAPFRRIPDAAGPHSAAPAPLGFRARSPVRPD